MIRYAIVDTSSPVRPLDAEYVQLRDKTVTAGELYAAAVRWKAALAGSGTKLLINHRADIAMAAGADGVHLTGGADELTADQVRRLFPRPVVVSVSCHTLEEVRKTNADLLLFGPVFEKRVGREIVAAGVGLAALEEACQATRAPVLALGGVTPERVGSCTDVGAAGVAAIRMFQPRADFSPP